MPVALILPDNWPYPFASARDKCQTRHISSGHTIIQHSPSAVFFLTLRSSAQNDPSMKKKGKSYRPAQQAAHWSARRSSAVLIGGAMPQSRPCRLLLQDQLLTGERSPLGGDVTCEAALRAAVVVMMIMVWGCGSFRLCQTKTSDSIVFYFNFLKIIHSSTLHSIHAPKSAQVGRVPNTV